MRIEAILWSGTACFFVVIGAVYLITSGEPAGGVLLLAGTAFGALVAGWLWHASSTNPPRAEDRADADMADEAGVVGIFVTGSLEPLWLALSILAAALGLIIGLWLTAIGLGAGFLTTLGMARNSL